MPQEATTSSQELTAGGGGNTSTTSWTTGAKVPVSGTYVTENKYLRSVIPLAANETFPPGLDGKKATYTQLTTALATSGGKTSDGGFTTVKVDAGTV